MGTFTFRKWAAIGLWVGILAAGQPARSQTASEAASPLEDIVVTARRIQESAQTVPISIDALSSTAIERADIQNINDLQFHTPDLQIAQSAYQDTPTFDLRGSTQALDTEPSVTTYVNEVPQSGRSIVNSLYDLETIEVDKGPQGVQFGKNSTGGAILFVTRKPTDTFEGYVQAQGGNYGYGQFTGAINLPLNEVAKFRIAGDYMHRDGLEDNVNGADAWNQNHESARISMLLTPVSWLDNLTIVDVYRAREIPETLKSVGNGQPLGGLSGLYASSDPTTGLALGFLHVRQPSVPTPAGYPAGWAGQFAYVDNLPPGTIDNPFQAKSDVDVEGISNTTTARLSDNITLKNIAGYRDDKNTILQNETGGPAELVYETVTDWEKQFSDELQLHGSALKDSLQWTIGGFYANRTQDRTEAAAIADEIDQEAGRTAIGLNAPYVELKPKINDKNEAIYSFLRYQISSLFANPSHWVEGVHLTAGYRWTEDSYQARQQDFNTNIPYNLPGGPTGLPKSPGFQSYDYYCNSLTPAGAPLPGGISNAINPATCTTFTGAKFVEPSYQVGIDDQVTDKVLVYYTHSHSFKAGGLNPSQASPTLETYAPEKVTADEAGLKADWSLSHGMAVRTNLAFYQNRYENIQNPFTAVLNGEAQAATIDVPKAKLEGAEAVLAVIPLPSLELNASVGYEQGKNQADVDVPGAAPSYPTACPQHFLCVNGVPFTGVSRWIYDLGGSYAIPFFADIGTVRLSADYYHRSPQTYLLQNEAVGSTSQFNNTVPTIELANARLEWNHIYGSKWDGALFVKNIQDKRTETFGQNYLATLGYAASFYTEPRLFGASVRFAF